MTNIEAMKLALDALENHSMQRTYAGGVVICNAAITLRQAISEAEQVESDVKPKKAAEIYTEGYKAGKHDAEQAEQKPMALIEITYGRKPECYATGFAESLPEGVWKLFAAPPQREWVCKHCGENNAD